MIYIINLIFIKKLLIIIDAVRIAFSLFVQKLEKNAALFKCRFGLNLNHHKF